MTARMMSLPQGVSREGIKYACIHRPEIVKAVKHLVMDRIKEIHSNGDVKLWGMSLLNILRLSMATKTMDAEKEHRILDWEASIGGDYKFFFNTINLYINTMLTEHDIIGNGGSGWHVTDKVAI